MSEPRTSLTLQSVALPFLALAAFTAFCYLASPLLIPVVVSISLAYILSPLVFLLNRLKIPHYLSVLLVLLVAIIVIALVSYLIIGQANSFVLQIPHYWNQVISFLAKIEQKLIDQGAFAPGQGPSVQDLQLKNFTWLPQYLARGLSSLLSFVLGLVFVFFLTFFILNEYPSLKKRIIRAFGSSNEEISGKILTEINEQIRGFVVVKFYVTIALSVIFTLGFMLLGVSYAYILGPLAGVLSLVPYIGPLIGLVLPLLVTAIEFKAFLPVLWVFLFSQAIHQTESNLVTPKLLENKINLNSLTILIASMFWAWLWGAIGIVLAVPITAAIKVVCDHVESLKPIGIILGGKKEE
ncbi:MAG TPA: AI-2E family transporter [Terriglobales bacterium]|nr:AI-2E family transporter [Terriglobales bacterium]